MFQNVELRKLPAGSLCNVAAILEINNDWKKVMSYIPRNPQSEYFEPKYNNGHIQQIEDHASIKKCKCAEILFDEWGTSGRIRPTLNTLKDVVLKAEIYRAADEIAAMLQEALPLRPPDGPPAPVPINLTELLESAKKKLDTSPAQEKTTDHNETSEYIPNFEELLKLQNSSQAENNLIPTTGVASSILRDANLIHFEYRLLENITKRFSETLIYVPSDPAQGVQGRLAGKIGSGGFGEVFVGYHPQYGHLAVKKARMHPAYDCKPDMCTRIFNAEVRFLSKFRHKNIVPIVGFSKDGPSRCIVCEYIEDGSLEQKLKAKFLTEEQRINIMIGTAEGLKYLHGGDKPEAKSNDNDHEQKLNAVESFPKNSLKKNNFVHGDVKTANILLTKDLVPKLCDFGLAKEYDSTYKTTCPMGTCAYMAPEGFGGTITQMGDIYSYGIVLLELLTGLKSIVINDRETLNIKEFIEETCGNNGISNVLDPIIHKWTKANEIYDLAKSCLKRKRTIRPSAEDICNILYKIYGVDEQH